MLYDCPDRYRYGAECKLSCKHGYPHGVTTVIKCTNIDKDANPPKLDWIPWPKDGPDPYCKGNAYQDFYCLKTIIMTNVLQFKAAKSCASFHTNYVMSQHIIFRGSH